MTDPLVNPVFSALCTGEAHWANGNDIAKYFDEEVSPFAGFDTDVESGFAELKNLLPVKRKILYANPEPIQLPDRWKLIAEIKGLQFVCDSPKVSIPRKIPLTALGEQHIDEMLALTHLTKPGPFNKRTIQFGNYFGIFENDKLVAMAGQRMRIYDYVEVSAVCTHPDFVGKGYAAVLLQHQLDMITADKKTPILHVRADNERAIKIYERLGFKRTRDMNFYFTSVYED